MSDCLFCEELFEAMGSTLTVGDLKRKIEDLPDGTPVMVETRSSSFQTITSHGLKTHHSREWFSLDIS